MGVAVFAGMIGVTIFGLVLTPVFYWVVQRLVAGARSRAERRSISDMNAIAGALIP
jgi:gold/copper resistance efflux pump